MEMEESSMPKHSSLSVEGGGDSEFHIIEEDCSDSDDDKKHSRALKLSTNNALTILAGGLQRTSKSTVFGKLDVSYSENVQIGDNTYFNGPVTIKQILQSSGIENDSYVKTDLEDGQKKTPNGSGKHQPVKLKRWKIKTWHKVALLGLCTVVIVTAVCTVLLSMQQERDIDISQDIIYEANSSSKPDDVAAGACVYYFDIFLYAMMVGVPLILLFISFSLTKWVVCTIDDDKINSDNKDIVNDIVYHNIKDNPLIIAPHHLRIVQRADWLAQPPEGDMDLLHHPAPWVIIAHTATEGCNVQSDCVKRVRIIQQFHIESQDWSDIGYNWLIGGDGSAYVGRGWDYEGAHTKGYNNYSIGIALIGTYNNFPPQKQQVEALKKLIKVGVDTGKINKDYKLLAQRQLWATKSPGDELYNIIKEWPHFVKDDKKIAQILANVSR